ncbi:hypothetical protein BDV93DRAFT_564651 [Ceratobasidium sp. AG-I]|nr:hypothetical protein BDV93DRAFT_564651 [Ceratobasidium sp. AG-I]
MVDSGTTRWMTPELPKEAIDLGLANMGKLAVAYALGITTLEVTTGRVPYSEHLNDASVMLAVIKRLHPQQPVEISRYTTFVDEKWLILRYCWRINLCYRPTVPLLTSFVGVKAMNVSNADSLPI